MKDWYQGLQLREQRLVLIGAIVVVLTLFWMLVWNPLTINLRIAEDEVARKQSLLQNGRRVLRAPAAASAGGELSPTCRQSLTLLVANTVRDAELGNAYRSSTPFGNGGVRVSLENASFDDTVGWLGRLQNDCGIAVDSGAFTKRPDPGRVDVNVALERGG